MKCKARNGENVDAQLDLSINAGTKAIDLDVYQPRNPKVSGYYRCVEDHFEQLEADRIVYYYAVARDAVGSDDLGEKLLEAIRREVEILWMYQEGFGVDYLDPRPLYFALSALEKAVEDGCTIDASRTEEVLTRAQEFAKDPVQTAEDERFRAMLIKKVKRVRKRIRGRPTD